MLKDLLRTTTSSMLHTDACLIRCCQGPVDVCLAPAQVAHTPCPPAAVTHVDTVKAGRQQKCDETHAVSVAPLLPPSLPNPLAVFLAPQGTNDAITMLNNGCLCCTVRDDLVKALNKLYERKDSLDHIIIETTGWSIVE